MKFIDNTIINISAGKGGDGLVSFSKSRKLRKGKPDGGSGGNGGNIYLLSNKSIYCLSKLNKIKNFFAENGYNGKKNNCTGKSGNDLFILVPIGTLIINYHTKEIIGDLVDNYQKLLIAKGGNRGLGNNKFKSSINRSPNYSTKGKLGEKYTLELELQLISNVGIFGLVNSGKSTLFKLITNIKNIKISDYNFTTLYPRLGSVYLNPYNYFSILDIPGFIFNYKSKEIINIKFFNHLKRCKLLLHIIDISLLYEKNLFFITYIKSINKKLNFYNLNISSKNVWIIFNKFDLYKNENINKKVDNLFKKFNIKFNYYIISSLKNNNNYKNYIIYDIYKFLFNK